MQLCGASAKPRGAAATVCLVLISLCPFPVFAESSTPKRVLALYAFGRDYPTNVKLNQSLQSALQAAPNGSVEYYAEYLESDRFSEESQFPVMHDYLRRKYAGRRIDAVIATSHPSLQFLLKYRYGLFPDTPVIFLTLKRRSLSEQAAGLGLTGVVVSDAYKSTLGLALKLHPATKQALIVSGTPERDRSLEIEARQELKEYEGRVTLTYLTDLPVDELIANVRGAPERSIILYIRQSQDESGKSLAARDFLALIAQAARVPVYGISYAYLGYGVVGGYVSSPDVTGAKLAEIALRVANGARPQDIQVTEAPNVPMFDWRQLRRWGISEERLPAGSGIQFQEFSFWDQYRRYVISAISLIVIQTGLIGSLLFERRRRRRAEEARRHLAAIVEFSDDGIIGTSLDGQILSWNPGAESMYDYTASEMLGRHISVIVPPDRLEELSESLRKRRSGEHIKDFETVRLRKDGTRINVSVSVSPIKDDRGRVIAAATIHRDISERKRAEKELQRLTGHLLNLQDDERRRLARELHDVTAQNLFAINMNLSRLQRGRVEPAEVKEILAESRNLGQQSLQEIRTLSYLLHPPMLDQVGLVDALKWYVDGFVKRSGIDVALLPAHGIGRLPSEVETALFRIVQEGLSNIKRHSGSSSANIKLEKHEDRVVLQIRDHGRGMKSEAASAESDVPGSLGVGITGMRQRLHQLGGNLQIDSSDRGTLVTAVVPIANGGTS